MNYTAFFQPGITNDMQLMVFVIRVYEVKESQKRKEKKEMIKERE